MNRKQPSYEGSAPPHLIRKALFEHALHEVHVWKVVRDASGRIVTWRLVEANPPALEAWGRELDDVVGLTADEIFVGADATRRFLPIVEEIFATGAPKEWELEFEWAGETLHMVSVPLGEYFVSTGFDTTELRERERERDRAVRSLQHAIQAGGVGLWDWDLQTDEVFYSDEWKAQLGYAPHEVEHTFEAWSQRIHPDDLEKTLAVIRESTETINQEHETLFRMRHKDGSYRWILAQASFVLDSEGRPARMLGSHVDVTQRRRLEERVMESQKLEAVGTLAAGIAHDLNNLLTVIRGNLSLAREAVSAGADPSQVLRDVEDATDRVQDLTYQLLTFSKGGAPVMQVASMERLLEDSARFITSGSRSKCECLIAPDLPGVEMDVGQISRVVSNLLINADQAMPEGGRIEIRAYERALGRGNDLGLEPGGYVEVSVKDQGCGIAPEALSRVFEPFFTTKPEGTGLGLAAAYSIVAKHGGAITVDSHPGEGTTFSFCLPASDTPVAPERDKAVVPGSGRLLVMDDNEAVRTALQRMLQTLGYVCDTTAANAETVRRYEAALESGRPYDAVILDLTIPGEPGGHHTLAELRRLDPHVLGIVASGYADHDMLAAYEDHGFQGRLRKPVELSTLSLEVSRVLARVRTQPR